MTNINIYNHIHNTSHALDFTYIPDSNLGVLRSAIHYYTGAKLLADTNPNDSAVMMRIYKSFIIEYVKYLATMPVTPILSQYYDQYCPS